MKLFQIKPQIVAPLIVLSFLSIPAAMADTPFTWHHMNGPVQQRETNLSREIQNAFEAGLINGYEMAQLERDLDGARAENDYFAIDSTTARNRPIMSKLNKIEQVLDAHAARNLSWEVAVVQ